MLMPKQKKNQTGKSGVNRFLINVTVMGSPGPIRFVVNEEDLVATVMDTTLKFYAREGRLPVLGSHINDFVLYCPIAGTEALDPLETIGSLGMRNFMLCKKPQQMAEMSEAKPAAVEITRKSSGSSWKAWFNKSVNLKVSTH